MFATPAYAQSAAGGLAGIGQFLPLILIFAIMYFLLIRPQQKKAKEHKAMVAIMSRESGGDRTKSDRIDKLVATTDAIEGRIDKMNGTIDAIVEAALVEVEQTLTREKAELASYRREFLLYEAESRELGGTVLGSAFRDVKSKFYDVLVRSDVGVVDVSWSQKEDADEDLRRIELDKSRELKQLKDEFRDLLEEDQGGTP